MIKSLGYIGYEVTDLVAWKALLGDQLGLLENKEASVDGPVHFRVDGAASRISLFEGASNRLLHLGWDAGSSETLSSIAKSLEKDGVTIDQDARSLAEKRYVDDLIAFNGPDSVRHEIFVGQHQAPTAFSSSLVTGGFRTGAQGLGHAVLAASDRTAVVEWYQSHLGFRLSDEIFWDDAEATFLHCNARHHSLAILNCCMGMKAGDMNHLMLEMNSLEDVGRAYDRVRESGTPLALQIGQHINDKVLSFYLVNPSGSAIEVGYGGIAIDDTTWQSATYDTPKIWGHDPAGAAPSIV